MNYIIGVDGGGTKTDYLLIDSDGAVCAVAKDTGSSYRHSGVEAVAQQHRRNVHDLLNQAGVVPEQLAGVCIGAPCYGEHPEADRQLEKAAEAVLGGLPVLLVNDVEVGWAGSLACTPGINVVAGTGSIAYGRDSRGRSARCGGWSEHFSDEGSCYWAARQAMELFTKQADGRVERGRLYALLRQHLDLDDDFAFIQRMEGEYLPLRDRVASLQILLCQAAEEGDASAAEIYCRAARELALLAVGVGRALEFEGERVAVSYSGGMFRAGDLVLGEFAAILRQQGMAPVKPRFSPIQGAALLGVSHWLPQRLEAVTQRFAAR